MPIPRASNRLALGLACCLVCQAARGGELVERSYDLSELLRNPKGTPSRAQACRGWAEYVRASVAPESWRSAGGAIRVQGERLVVRNTETVHEGVRKLLDWHATPKARNTHVHVRALVVSIDESAFNAFGLTFSPIPGPTRPKHPDAGRILSAPLDKKQLYAVQDAIKKHRPSADTCTQFLTMHNGRLVDVRDFDSHHYVRRISPDNEPEFVETFRLQVQPFVSPDAARPVNVLHTLSVSMKNRELERLKGPRAFPVHDGGGMLFQLTLPYPWGKSKAVLILLLTTRVLPHRPKPVSPTQ